MKKIIMRILMAIAIMISVFTDLSAHDFSATYNGKTIYYSKLTSNTCAVTYYGTDYNSAKYSGAITIPASVTYGGITYSVTSIGFCAFCYCTSLTSVSLPSSLKYICEGAFGNCTSLTSVSLPSSLTDIGVEAFYRCSSLTTISLPNSVTSIGDWVFENCTALSSISLPNNLSYIGNGAFRGCTSLPVYNNLRYADDYLVEAIDKNQSTYTIKEDTRWIGYYAFGDCTTLSFLSLPNGVTKICNVAFSGCTSLTSIDLPNSVTFIGEEAFNGCTSLSSISLPESITFINYNAFSNCTSLSSISLPESITTIGEGAFSNCTSLSSISLPESITTIGEGAFNNCTSLSSVINLATTPQEIDSYVFSNVPLSDATLYVPSASLQAYKNADGWCDFGSIKSIIASGSCGAYGDNLTYTLTEDGHLTISGSGPMADWEWFQSPFYKNRSKIESVVISEGVTSIGRTAFISCTSITSISLPKSITSIGKEAFSYCESLTSITLPEGLSSIDVHAFNFCTALTSISFPESITSIGESAFYGCTALTSISLPEGLTSIGNSAFANCTSLSSISVNPANLYYSSLDGVLFNKDQSTILCYPCGKPGSYKVPNTVTSIGDVAFFHSSSLTSLSLPEGLTSIGIEAFEGCDSLSSISLPETLTSIGEYAFQLCKSLTSITNLATTPQNITSYVFNDVPLSTATLCVPSASLQAYKTAEGWRDFGSIKSIIASGSCGASGDNLTYTLTEDGHLTISGSGPMADWDYEESPFYQNRDAIKSVELSEGITYLGSYAFSECRALSDINLPCSLTSIAGSAFDGCSALTDINLPSSVTTIGDYAFIGCYSLTSITVNPANPNFSSLDGILFNKDQTTIICCPIGKHLVEYSIPSSVTSIGNYAFYDCYSLTSITIPYGVTAIGEWAFQGCM